MVVFLDGRDGRTESSSATAYTQVHIEHPRHRRDISLRDCVRSMAWILFVQRHHQSDNHIQKSEHHRRRAFHVVRLCLVPPYTQKRTSSIKAMREYAIDATRLPRRPRPFPKKQRALDVCG